MTFCETITVPASPPFNFDLTAQIFQNGDKQIRTYTNGQFSLVLKINEKLAQVKVSSIGTVERPELRAELITSSPITNQDKKKAREIVAFIFSLDFNLRSFYYEIRNDLTMNKMAQQFCGLKSPTTPTVFESLVDSIIEQQISIKVAIALEEKLIKELGDRLDIDGDVFYAFPTPQNLASDSIDEIQQIGLSRRKAEYIHGVARLIVDGKLNLEGLKTCQNPEEIIAELDAVRGIGVWTAELTMLRGMQKLDAFPADDLGVRRVISKYYCNGKPIKAEEAREISNSWGRWKGLAAFYLIIAEIKGLEV